MNEQKGAKVGLISRIDYGSQGCRRGLVDVGFDILRNERVHYVICVGGLISHKATLASLKDFVKSTMEADKDKKRKLPKEVASLPKSKQLKARKRQLEDEFLQDVAEDLSKFIPKLTVPDESNPNKERGVDIFVVTSPAFDGELGETVAHYLAALRPDIRVWNQGGDRFPVKYVDKLIWALAPQKAVWMRGDYYSTSVERLIKDKIKQSSQSSPDLYAIGCFGSSINKPKGELKYSYVSVPVLHRLEETRVNENQIGVGIVEFPADGGQWSYRVHSLKDLVQDELTFTIAPNDASALQKRIIGVMKEDGRTTLGLLKYALKDVTGEKITEALENLMKKKTINRIGENWPGLTFNDVSKKYHFDLKWIQHKLKYPVPESVAEDGIATFACVHAGSTETDIKFFVDEVPEIILKIGATILVDAGDTKEGSRHDLIIKQEVFGGMNNTQQEKFAAHLIGKVIYKVFEARFKAGTGELKRDAKDYSQNMLGLIDAALLRFVYIYGNHDLWETGDGHTPLVVFRASMVKYLSHKISAFLEASDHVYARESLAELIEKKIKHEDFFDLPSGLKVSVQHPHMSRAKTTSLRPQEMLDYAKRHGCQIAIGGNFHVSENVEEWDSDLGQCVCMEIGTIKHGSSFERHKMKMVDQGVGYLRIRSAKTRQGNGKKQKSESRPRIIMTESAFYGASEVRPPINNVDVLNAFIATYGIDPIEKD